MITRDHTYGFLQLFAVDGAGGAAPTPAAGGAPAPTGAETTPAPAPAAGGPTPGQQAAPGAPGAQDGWTPEKDAAFAKRLEAERAKIRQQTEADFRQKNAHLFKFGELLGQDGYNLEQMASSYERERLAAQAQQQGLNPQVYADIQGLRQQVQTLAQRERVSALQAEAKTLQAEHGTLFDTHAQQALDRAAQTGESLEDAFGALAWKEIRAAERGKAEQAALAQITGRDNKAPVNGTGGPQVTPNNDVRNMSKADFEKLKADVKAGRRTSL